MKLTPKRTIPESRSSWLIELFKLTILVFLSCSLLNPANSQSADVEVYTTTAPFCDEQPLNLPLVCPGDNVRFCYIVTPTPGSPGGFYRIQDAPFGITNQVTETFRPEQIRFQGGFDRCAIGESTTTMPTLLFSSASINGPYAPITINNQPDTELTTFVMQVDASCNETFTISECTMTAAIPDFDPRPNITWSFPLGFDQALIAPTNAAEFGAECLSRRTVTTNATGNLDVCGGSRQTIVSFASERFCVPISCTQTVSRVEPTCTIDLTCVTPAPFDCSAFTDLASVVFPDPVTNITCTFAVPPDVGDASCCVSDLQVIAGPTLVPGACTGNFSVQRTLQLTVSGCVCTPVSETCVQTIQFQDSTPPAITMCPGTITNECGNAVPAPSLGELAATDDCSDPVIFAIETGPTAVPGTANCTGVDIQRYILSATDACGNQALCTQDVVTVDTVPPTLTCPPDAAFDCDAGAVPAINTIADIIGQGGAAGDTCSDVTLVDVTTDAPAAGTCPQNLVRTIIISDACGNLATCMQNIAVNDAIPPTCAFADPAAEMVTVECLSEAATVALPVLNPMDNCGIRMPIDPPVVTTQGVPCSVADPLSVVRTFTFFDLCGNSVDCAQTIQVLDTTPPTITCPADMTMDCTGENVPSVDAATVNDNCPGDVTVTLATMQTTLDCVDGGPYALQTNVWTATDLCGNAVSCTQTVTFTDSTAPTIDILLCVTQDCSAANVGFTDPTNAMDNCDPLPVVEIGMAMDMPVADLPMGCAIASQRVVNVFDACGNTNTLIQKLFIEDITPPTCVLVGDGVVDFGCVDMRPMIDCVCFCDSIGTTNVVQMLDPLGVPMDPVGASSEEVNRDAVFNGGAGSQVGFATFQNLLNMAYPNGAGGVIDLEDPSQITSNGLLVANFGGCKTLTISNSAPFQVNPNLPGDGPVFTPGFTITNAVPSNPGNNDLGGPISGTNVLYDRQFVFDLDLDSPGDCERITHFGFVVLDRELSEEEQIFVTNVMSNVVDCTTDNGVVVEVFDVAVGGAGTLGNFFGVLPGGAGASPATFSDCLTDPAFGEANNETMLNTVDALLTANGVPTINGTDDFIVRWFGNIEIPATGTYTFRTGSDDGNRLYIDGNFIVGLDVTRPYTLDTSGPIELAAGCYTFEFQFFEDGGGDQVSLAWDTNQDGAFEAIPAGLLHKPGTLSITNVTTNTVITPIRTEPVVIASANFTDGTSGSLISSFAGDNNNGENTWYSFAAPPGEGIESVTVSRELGNFTNDFRIDDIAFISSCDNSGNLASQFESLEDDCSDVSVSFLGESETNMNCCSFLFREYMVMDDCGNSTICTQTFTWVEVEDHEPPTIISFPPEQDLGCNPDAIPSYEDIIATLVATDNCAIAATQLVKTVDSTDGCDRSRTYVIRVSDKCWNSIECPHTIRWTEDTAAPAVVADTLNLGCNPESIPSPNELEGIQGTDDCSDVIFTFDNGDRANIGCAWSMTRNYTASDACGNSTTFQQTINWTEDDEAPNVTWPNDENLGCIAGGGTTVSAINTFEDAVFTGGQQTYFGMGGPQPINSAIEFPVFVGFYDIDLTDNSLTLTLQDNSQSADLVLPPNRFDRNYFEFPGATITSASLVGTNGFNQFANVQILPPGFVLNTVDIFGVGSPGPIVFENGGLCLEFGEGADYSVLGTTAQVSFTKVSQADALIPPVASTLAGIAATDNCGVSSTNYLGSHTSAVVNCQMSVTRFYRVLDLCGNAVDGEQTFTFSIDGDAPTLLADTLDLGCNPQFIPTPNELEGIQAFDDCGDPAITITGLVSRTTNNCTITMIRGYQAEDDCGNVANGEQTIIWTVDNEDPAITAHPSGGHTGCTLPPAPDVSAVIAVDNCAVVSTALVSSVTNALPDGCESEAIRVYSASDACGNSREVTVTWTWTGDDLAPEFTDLPQDINLGCAGLADIPAPDDTRFAVTDNCGVSNVYWVSDVMTPVPTQAVVSTYTGTGADLLDTQTLIIPIGVTLPLGSQVQGLTVDLEITHNYIGGLSASLVSPAGTVVPLFTNPASASGVPSTCSGINLMATFSDAGAAPIGPSDCNPFIPPGITGAFAPETPFAAFDGENAYGMWMLIIEDDALPNADLPNKFNVTLSLAHNPIVCEREMVRTYAAVDNCGNTASNTVSFTWTNDSTTPFTIYQYVSDLGCGTPTNIIDAADEAAAIEAASLDDCSVPVTAQFINEVQSTSGCLNSIERTYRLADDCGNTKDIPVIYKWYTNDEELGASITTPVDLGCSTVTNSLPAPNPADVTVTGEEACDTATVTHLGDSTIIGDCEVVIERLYAITDECESLVITQVFSSFVDGSRPFIDVDSPNIDLGCATLADVPAAEDIQFFADDNCNAIALTNATITESIDQTPCLTTITRFYVFTDTCGNSVRAQQVITLQESDAPGDTEAPVFVDLPAQAINLGCNPDSIPVPDVTAISVTDNCAVANVEWLGDIGDEIDGGADDDCLRSFTRTFRATDVCGNTEEASITYEWTVDVKPPQLQTTQLLDGYLGCNPSQSLEPDTEEVTATDICGGTNVLVELITDHRETNGCELAHLYIYRITDACGNFIDEEIQFSYKLDSTAPEFVAFPGDLDLGCNPIVVPNPDNTMIGANDLGDVGFDGCGNVVVTHARQQAANGCVVIISDTYTITDDCGNSDQQVHTITYKVDTEDPEFSTFPADVNLGCNPTLPPPFAGVVIEDNCDLPADLDLDINVVVISNGCDRVMRRTYTITDECGNKDSRTHTLEFTVDDEAPVFLDIDPVIDLGCNPTPIPPPDVTAFAVEDDCDEEIVVSLLNEFDTVVGCDTTRTRIYQARDGCDNVSVAQQILTWTSDTTPPTIIAVENDQYLGCNPVIPSAADGLASLEATDDCEIISTNVISEITSTVVSDDADFGCNQKMVRTYRVMDGCGNFTDVSVSFTWKQDNEGPTISQQPGNLDLGCNPGSIPGPDPSLVDATDNCFYNLEEATGTPGLSVYNLADLTTEVQDDCTWTRTYVYGAQDECGNTVLATQTITWVEDNSAPLVSTPITETDLGCNPDPADIPTEASVRAKIVPEDDCGGTTVEFVNTINNISDANEECAFSIEHVYRITDTCGNRFEHSHIIHWTEDTEDPQVMCPPDRDLGCNPGTIPPPQVGLVQVSDNCGVGQTIVVSETITTNGCDRSLEIVYEVSDLCGNSAQCSQRMTWTVDVLPPVFTDLPVGMDLGCNPATIPVATPNDIDGTDDCGTPDRQVLSQITNNIGCVWTKLVTYRLIDDCGNFTDAQVTHNWRTDTQAPVITACAPDMDLGCNPTKPAPTPELVQASDACTTVTKTFSGSTATTNGCNVSLVFTYTVADQCGNETTCEQTFTYIEDNEPPVVTSTQAGGDLGCITAAPPAPSAAAITANDDCGTVQTPVLVNRAQEQSGCTTTLTFTYRVADDCGNGTLQDVVYTYTQDTTDPVISNCPTQPIYILPDTNGGFPIPNLLAAGAPGGPVTASDNCEVSVVQERTGDLLLNGLEQVVITATDDCGNESRCVAVVSPATLVENRVWNDVNSNGIQDPGEPGIPGVSVDLLGPGGGVLATGTTDENGDVVFFFNPGDGTAISYDGPINLPFPPDNPTPSSTTLGVQVDLGSLPPGSEFTVQDNGDDAMDSDANADGATSLVPVSDGGSLGNLGVGIVMSTDIGGYIFNDVNADGAAAGENLAVNGLNGVTIRLIDSDNNVVATTTTGTGPSGESGYYEFNDVEPGDYILRVDPVTLPANLTLTKTGFESDITVLSGMDQINVDGVTNFGFFAQPTAVTLSTADATGGKVIWTVAEETDTIGYEVLDADGESVASIVLAEGGGSSYEVEVDGPGDYVLVAIDTSLAVEQLASLTHYVEAEATPVDGDAVLIQAEDGSAAFTTAEGDASYAVLGVGQAAKVLDVTDPDQPVRLIGGVLETPAGNAVYFSWDAGASISVE